MTQAQGFMHHITLCCENHFVSEIVLSKMLELTIVLFTSNQILRHTCCATPKSVSPRHCARVTYLHSKNFRCGGEPLATYCVRFDRRENSISDLPLDMKYVINLETNHRVYVVSLRVNVIAFYS